MDDFDDGWTTLSNFGQKTKRGEDDVSRLFREDVRGSQAEGGGGCQRTWPAAQELERPEQPIGLGSEALTLIKWQARRRWSC